MVAAIGRKKSLGSEGFSGEILKLLWENMIPYPARLLDITMNKGTLPAEWNRAMVIPVHKGVIDH
jgi:hypothetical protein